MSKLPFELLLALRYLRPRRTFVSVITLISILGVMLGVGVLIIVISVMQGFDEETRERIFAFTAHLQVVEDRPMEDYRDVLTQLHRHPEVTGAAPFVIGQVLLKTQPVDGTPQAVAPLIRGIDPALEREVSTVPASMIAGAYDVRGRGLLLGATLAEQLHLRVGDRVAVYSVADFDAWEKARRENREEAGLARDFEIRGIFDVGHYNYNTWAITSLANAQDMYNLEDRVHGLFVKLREPERAALVRQDLQQQLGGPLEIQTWMEGESRQLLEAILVEKQVMYYLLFFIVLVAAFGITSALITFVVQKTREIGLLKALGATAPQILWLFLSQSLIVGIAGVLSGYSLGMLALAYRNEFLHFMRRATGFELFPAAIYNFTELPAVIVPHDILVICGGSLLICLLAGALPALNAARLRPVEALRHE